MCNLNVFPNFIRIYKMPGFNLQEFLLCSFKASMSFKIDKGLTDLTVIHQW